MKSIMFKEFRELLYSPKFIVLSIASFLMIILSVVNGYLQYSFELELAVQEEQMFIKKNTEDKESYKFIHLEVINKPQKLSIFNTGVSGVVSRKGYTSNWGMSGEALENRYNNDPILAVFRELDLSFVVGVVISLFALLFSYDAIAGERERGTLKLMMANSVNRTSVIIGKFLGGIIPIVLIFFIPFLISLISLLMVTDISFSSDEWIKILLMCFTLTSYLITFYLIGLSISAITRTGFSSFLISLLVWIFFVGVYPRISMDIASFFYPQPDKAAYQKEISNVYHNEKTYPEFLKEYLEENRMTKEQYQRKSSEIWELINEKQVELRTAEMMKIKDRFDLKKKKAISGAGELTKLSPYSCMAFSVHLLTNTSPLMVQHFSSDLEKFNAVFNKWVKMKEANRAKVAFQAPFKFTESSDGTMKAVINERTEPKELDLSGMPKFKRYPPPLDVVVSETLGYLVVLLVYPFIFFTIAYVAFMRYDVR